MEIKQAELARRLGRPQSFIAKVEIGEQRVDVVEFPAIAHAMKVSPEKLLARLSKEIEATKKARR